MRKVQAPLVLVFLLVAALASPAWAGRSPQDAVYTTYLPIGLLNPSFASSCLSLSPAHGGFNTHRNPNGTYVIDGHIGSGAFSLTWIGKYTPGPLNPMSGNGSGTWSAVNVPRACSGGKVVESGRFTWVGTASDASDVVIRVTFKGFANGEVTGSGAKKKAAPPAYTA